VGVDRHQRVLLFEPAHQALERDRAGERTVL
jgi:hypothetical protein